MRLLRRLVIAKNTLTEKGNFFSGTLLGLEVAGFYKKSAATHWFSIRFTKQDLGMIAKILIGLVAAIHFYILWLEMFAWTTRGEKVFRRTRDFLERTKVLAANQGLYNGFLAAGLVWSLLIADPSWQKNVASFFLACVAIAGLYGGATVTKRILTVQALPAVLALVALYFVKY